jgi:phosphoglucomutase
MTIDPHAGKPAQQNILTDIAKLITSYYSISPDLTVPAQRVAFGTSGHRGCSFDGSFNEQHILAITQAICFYRKAQNIDGPLYIGFDTHALSEPAFASAMSVLAANGVEAMIAKDDEFTPTPVISFAILRYNKSRKTGLADGIVITPSHNPPDNGGFKYNPPSGGPAGTEVTKWIEAKAGIANKKWTKTV